MIVVDSVGYELVNGINLKYMIVHTPEFYWGFQNCDIFGESYKIYQTIGSLGYMFTEKICGADVDCVSELRCYEDSQFGFYSTNVADSCTYEYGVGVIDINYSHLLKVYPNPITDYFIVELADPMSNAELSVYSPDGRLIMMISIKSDITRVDFNQEKQGYIIKINTEGKIFQGRIIK
jgi:hypothetical protein